MNAECGSYGPRVIVRSIKRIKKGEEVTVTYTDLLQPKVSLISPQTGFSKTIQLLSAIQGLPKSLAIRLIICLFP